MELENYKTNYNLFQNKANNPSFHKINNST